jgi:peptidoglycan/xylan/chitin deacetylase (PgdA/CDA1 family)
MTVCLTGDIHHMSLGTGNQRHSDITEVQTAQRMLALLEEFDVKVTFFVSGKCFVEEWEELEQICRHPLVEIGGHNYSCFQPALVHRVWNKVLRSYNGPPFVQRRDARRTMEVIEARTGERIRCWRNHMYMHGPYTERVLSQCGLSLCSDGTDRDALGPTRHASGLLNFPINVIPDHEHLFHAERTREWVAWWQQRYDWSDDWGPESYEIQDWLEIVLADLERNEARGATSNMIIHPITMYLCDDFEALRVILRRLQSQPTLHMSEVL